MAYETEAKKTKNEALKILAQMNDMVRGRDFAKMVVSKEYGTLDKKIRSLGWLALVEEQSVVDTKQGKELQVRLKLVSPDSEEALNLEK